MTGRGCDGFHVRDWRRPPPLIPQAPEARGTVGARVLRARWWGRRFWPGLSVTSGRLRLLPRRGPCGVTWWLMRGPRSHRGKRPGSFRNKQRHRALSHPLRRLSPEGSGDAVSSVLVHEWHSLTHAGCVIRAPAVRERHLRNVARIQRVAASLRGGGGASRVAPSGTHRPTKEGGGEGRGPTPAGSPRSGGGTSTEPPGGPLTHRQGQVLQVSSRLGRWSSCCLRIAACRAAWRLMPRALPIWAQLAPSARAASTMQVVAASRASRACRRPSRCSTGR